MDRAGLFLAQVKGRASDPIKPWVWSFRGSPVGCMSAQAVPAAICLLASATDGR